MPRSPRAYAPLLQQLFRLMDRFWRGRWVDAKVWRWHLTDMAAPDVGEGQDGDTECADWLRDCSAGVVA